MDYFLGRRNEEMVTEARFELAITCTPSMYHTKLDYPVLINFVSFSFYFKLFYSLFSFSSKCFIMNYHLFNMNSKKYLLHEISWTDIEKLDRKKTVFLLPVGSTEQHGPQNPLGTDFLIAEHIARETAKRSPNVYCLPTLPFGIASHHRNFPGTLWLDPSTFLSVIEEVILSIHYHGFDKLVVVNGHGGNTASIMLAISEINDVHDMICSLFEWWKDEELAMDIFGVPSAVHADTVETSTVWAAYPDLVKEERFEGLKSAEKWGREIGDLYISSRTDQFTETGIAGPVGGFSIEKGKKILEGSINKLLSSLEKLSKYEK